MKRRIAFLSILFLSFAGAAMATPNAGTAPATGIGSAAPTAPVAHTLSMTDLSTTTGGINWRKAACWTGVVTVAVAGSLGGSPGAGAVLSGALAVYCLTL